jgi:hypothetical protein
VIGDETWVSFVNVETTEQSKQWMTHIHQTHRKSILSARMLMATVFWDRKGVLMVEFMEQGTTTMSEVYCKTLQILGRLIQKRC